ncbi:hypothetical protein BMR86_25850, partial [Stenotrophomonas sp. KAs 5-3]
MWNAGMFCLRAGTVLAELQAHAPDLLACVACKPDALTAREYLEGGRHLWNAGMFCLRAGTVLAELQAHAPDLLACVA